MYFYLLILLTSSVMYGQTLLSSPSFRSSASIVYLKAKPKLYLVNAEVRFYANFKIKYEPPVKGRSADEFNMVKAMKEIVETYDPAELEEEEEENEEQSGYVKIPSERVYSKSKGWLDEEKRADKARKGFHNAVGSALLIILGGK